MRKMILYYFGVLLGPKEKLYWVQREIRFLNISALGKKSPIILYLSTKLLNPFQLSNRGPQ